MNHPGASSRVSAPGSFFLYAASNGILNPTRNKLPQCKPSNTTRVFASCFAAPGAILTFQSISQIKCITRERCCHTEQLTANDCAHEYNLHDAEHRETYPPMIQNRTPSGQNKKQERLFSGFPAPWFPTGQSRSCSYSDPVRPSWQAGDASSYSSTVSALRCPYKAPSFRDCYRISY